MPNEASDGHKHKTRDEHHFNVLFIRESIIRIDWIPCRVLLALIPDQSLFRAASIAHFFDAMMTCQILGGPKTALSARRPSSTRSMAVLATKAQSDGTIAQAGQSGRSEGQQQAKRRDVLKHATLLGAVAAGSTLFTPAMPAKANRLLSSDWEIINVPVDEGVVFLDVAFTGTDPLHGFLVGTRQTLLETFDGGRTWESRSVAAATDEGFNFRFNSISFNGDEGWIVGKPSILLHSTDGGKNWERIPLSAKLPGVPQLIIALDGPGAAEMTTDQGAIYVTSNAALNWTAAVQETVDATLNRVVSSGISGASYYEGSFSTIQRSDAGDYLAVSARGNFFMSFQPGDTYWHPHNRPAPRRLQNMGFIGDNVWLTCKGGDLYTAPVEQIDNVDAFKQVKINSRGYGILDVKAVTKDVVIACGGGGSLWMSRDGGKTWKREKAADDIAANLYEITSSGGNTLIMGNDGVLLRYTGTFA